MSKQIYVDMDGVVSDFDGAIEKLFGARSLGRNAGKFWQHTCVEAQPFRHMDPIPEGIAMVLMLIEWGHRVCMLSSTGGMPHHIDIAKQKLDWLHANGLGAIPVAFCMNTEGKGYFAHKDAVLIDDREKVIDVWRHNGGRGILFSKDSVAKILKTLKPRQ